MTGGTNRPGFGERHLDLAVLLARHKPAATGETSWMGGTMPLRVSAYITPTAGMAAPGAPRPEATT